MLAAKQCAAKLCSAFAIAQLMGRKRPEEASTQTAQLFGMDFMMAVFFSAWAASIQ